MEWNGAAERNEVNEIPIPLFGNFTMERNKIPTPLFGL